MLLSHVLPGKQAEFISFLHNVIYKNIDNLLCNMPPIEVPLLISFSGGRTSAMMAYIIMTHPAFKNYRKICAFANTGKELEETLIFVKACDDVFGLSCTWIESFVYHDQRKASGHQIVDFSVASREGQPFEQVIMKYGIPNQSFPHCTRELKLNPLKSYLRSLGLQKWTNVIGLRFDESRRIRTEKIQGGYENFYPLFYLGLSAKHVQDFWAFLDFDLNLKSYQGNCDLCWKKSLKKKLRILKEKPQIATFYINMEEKYGESFVGENVNTLVQHNFHRKGQSTQELLEISQGDIETFVDPYDGNEIGCGCNIGEAYEPD